MDDINTVLYSFDEDTMFREYFKRTHNLLLNSSLSVLYEKLQTISYSDLLKHVRLFENSIESDIYEMFYKEEDLANNNIAVYKSKGSSTTERIGSAIEWSIESSVFLKYLVCLSYIYAHYSFKSEIKKHLLLLLSPFYYESRKRLLLCKDIMPEDTSIVFSGFIRDNCKRIKSDYSRKKAAKIKKSFDENFKVCRDYMVPQITITNNSPDNLDKIRVTVELKGIKNIKSHMQARTALVFLALLHNYLTKSDKKFTCVTYENLCEGYDIIISGDKTDKITSDIVSNINTRRLSKFKKLFSIEGSKIDWRLAVKNNKLKIIYKDFFLHKKFARMFYFKKPNK